MPKSRRLVLLSAVVLAGAGGFAAYYFYLRPKAVAVAPNVGDARSRGAVPVPAVTFTDVTPQSRVAFKHENGTSGRKLMPETMGGGVAVLDYDRDGRQDLLFVNSCPWPGHQGGDANATPRLYRNRGDGTFEDVTSAAGLDVRLYGVGVAVGDFDNDTYPDVFVSCVGKHRLFKNEAGKRFRDVTDEAQVGGPIDLPKCSWGEFVKWDKPIPFGSSATFVDYDGDARLDLFVCHYVTWSPKADLSISSTLGGLGRAFVRPSDLDGTHCKLFRNVDGKRFEDVTDAAGLKVVQPDGTGPNATLRPLAKALGVIVCDPDQDGWPDLVVANDTVRNFFFHNVAGPDGTRAFKEDADRCYLAYADQGVPRGGMGIDWGEYLPGRNAVVITNFANEPNTFFRQAGPKALRFSDAALSIGLAGPSRSLLKFGAFFFDYDLDGRLDLLTANGHIEPDINTIQRSQTHEQPAQLFWNTGDPSRLFESVPSGSAGADLFKPLVGRGSAYLDLDSDGDLDVVLVGNNGPARVLRNDNALGNKWLRVTLEGDGTTSNRSAIGAEVTVEAGGKTYRRQVAGARGYLSQSEFPVTVGLGPTAKVDKVTVRWPGKDAKTQEWTNLDANAAYVLAQGDAAARPVK